ncbi:MAG: hypothetical protein BWY85_00146 [Firmicutes bacterium ADurb.Bin506]|nr:MAG: hypothetical protein BWY85_00146 [Firmicutes bacterium ADurb.Bin506]
MTFPGFQLLRVVFVLCGLVCFFSFVSCGEVSKVHVRVVQRQGCPPPPRSFVQTDAYAVACIVARDCGDVPPVFLYRHRPQVIDVVIRPVSVQVVDVFAFDQPSTDSAFYYGAVDANSPSHPPVAGADEPVPVAAAYRYKLSLRGVEDSWTVGTYLRRPQFCGAFSPPYLPPSGVAIERTPFISIVWRAGDLHTMRLS